MSNASAKPCVIKKVVVLEDAEIVLRDDCAIDTLVAWECVQVCLLTSGAKEAPPIEIRGGRVGVWFE